MNSTPSTRPTRGAYFAGIRACLTTRIDDLPPVPEGYESIARAADDEMYSVFAADLRRGDLR